MSTLPFTPEGATTTKATTASHQTIYGPFQQSSYPRSHPYYHHLANPVVSAATGLTTTTALPTTSYNVKHRAHSVLPPLPYSLPFLQCLYFYLSGPAKSPTSAQSASTPPLSTFTVQQHLSQQKMHLRNRSNPFFSSSPLYPGKPDKSPVTSLAKGEQPQPNPPGFLPLQSPPYPVAHLPYPFAEFPINSKNKALYTTYKYTHNYCICKIWSTASCLPSPFTCHALHAPLL